MNIYLATLLAGFSIFIAGVCWTIFYLMKMANDEEPGCINPNRHK